MQRKETALNQAGVEVWSRQYINKGFGRGGVLISVLQPITKPLLRHPEALEGEDDLANISLVKPVDGWRKIHSLRFLDSTPAERTDHLFTEYHAEQIWKFLDDVTPSETINVHCAAGISRSVAIGLVVADALGRSLVVHSGVGIRFANPHVTRLMREKMWVEHFNRE